MDTKSVLIQKRQKIQEELEKIKQSAQPVDLNAPIGRLSRMDAIAQQQVILGAKKQLELTLVQIGAALLRVKDGTYGHCLKCDEEISPKRLQAKPEATLCLECQAENK